MTVNEMSTLSLIREISSYESALEEVTQVKEFRKLCNELTDRFVLLVERIELLSELLQKGGDLNGRNS